MNANNGWVKVTKTQPPTGSQFMVTNNLTARDRTGRMTHVWIATSLQTCDCGCGIAAFVDLHGSRIHSITHWCEVPKPEERP